MQKTFILLALGLILLPGAAESRTKISDQLVLYTSCDPEWSALLAKEFEKTTGTKVEWIREGTGVVLQRLKAEKNQPKATVWFGGTFDGHAKAAELGLLEAYVPTNRPELGNHFQNPLGNNLSTGVYGGVLGFAVNENLLKKMGKPVPQTWDDLLNPIYKGLIAMANPNISGTAYTILATIMKKKGEQAGLAFMKQLHQNVAQYTQSGAAPITLVGKGEAAIAIIFAHDAVKARLEGYPIREVIPADGTGYEIGGLSLVKNGPNVGLGKKFIDWVLSPAAQKLAPTVGAFQVPSNTKTPLDQNVIPFERVKLVDLPIAWITKNREMFLKSWTEQVFAKK